MPCDPGKARGWEKKTRQLQVIPFFFVVHSLKRRQNLVSLPALVKNLRRDVGVRDVFDFWGGG